MAQISEQSIDQVRQAADVVDVISQYVELKQKGQNFFGLCPFHTEKTPSFSVNPNKQIYKCFGCGSGGGSINFVMEIENLEFPEAIKHLAQNYNITLDIKGGDSKKFSDTKTQIIAIHELASAYYQKMLLSEKGLKALNYLNERGLNENTISEFKIGFSPDSYDDLLVILRKESFSAESMKLSGLFIKSEKGYFNRFRSRIMFPIQNYKGNVIAFGGRIFNKEDSAKYLNSPETPIYNKSNVCYGIFQNAQKIREAKKIVLVEGYMDLIQLAQAGIDYCLAISGTAFTNGHAAILQRYTKNIYITFDGDDAGKKAALKCAYILAANSIGPQIVSLGDGMDPDDWIKKNDIEKFNQILTESKGVINAHYNYFSSLNSHGALSINEFIQECLNEIINIKDPIIKEIMIKEISELTSIDQKNILQVLNEKNTKKLKYKTQKDTNVEQTTIVNDNFPTKLYDDLIRICFAKDKKIREFIFTYMDENWLLSKKYKEIYSTIYIHLKGESEPPINVIADQMDNQEIRQKLIDLTFDIEKFNPNYAMATDCIIRLEQNVLRNNLNELRNKLKKLDESSDNNILNQLTILEGQIADIKNKYNNE